MKGMKKDIAKEFPAVFERHGGRRLVYLDSACTALKMKSAADEQRRVLLEFGACAGKRSSHSLASSMEEIFYGARRDIASYIGASSPDEVVFSSGTTDSVNLFLNAFPFSKERNEVIVSSLEHNSVLLPLHLLSLTGRIRVRLAPLKGFSMDTSAMAGMINKRTALVCATRASNIFGGKTDISELSAAARSRGASLFVDDAQFVPTHGVSSALSGADACAFSGHKMGAPFGIGALWVSPELMSRLSPAKAGGGVVKSVSFKNSIVKPEFLQGYQRFEPGIQNYSGAAAIAEAFRTLESFGFPAIRQKMSGLVGYCCRELMKTGKVKLLGSPESLVEGAIVSFEPLSPGFSMPDFNVFLNRGRKGAFCAVRTGRMCADLAFSAKKLKDVMRVSFFVYNNNKDVDFFVSALEEYCASI